MVDRKSVSGKCNQWLNRLNASAKFCVVSSGFDEVYFFVLENPVFLIQQPTLQNIYYSYTLMF
jgi:hypothetical protein